MGRVGLSIYEFEYGDDFSVSNTRGNNGRYALLMCSIIIAPLVSVAYLIIFLKIEPHAYDHFKTMFYLDSMFFKAEKRTLDSSKRSINVSIARDTNQVSIDSDNSLTSISINSRESLVVDNRERKSSSFIMNPTSYVLDFIRESLISRPSVFDDRTEVELSCVLEDTPLCNVTRNSADVIDTTINSNIHDVDC